MRSSSTGDAAHGRAEPPRGAKLPPVARPPLPRREPLAASSPRSRLDALIDAPRHSGNATTRWLALAVATGGGVGLLPGAPGSYGAALALPIFVLLSPLAGVVLLVSWLALLALGTWAADAAERIFGREDDGRIVIDEVVGQLLTLAPLLPAGVARNPLWLVTGFVAFRVFDIWKPGPVRRAERGFSGGLGVMMDDVVAGVAGAAVLGVLLLALHLARLAGGASS